MSRNFSPGLLTDIKQHASHTLGKLFGYEPSHSIRSCQYCFERVRHRGSEIVNDKLPLNVQQQQLTSSKITRFSICIAYSYLHKSYYDSNATTYGQEMSLSCKNGFQCTVNRLLLQHQDYVFPTTYMVQDECKELLKNCKTNDHVIVYLRAKQEGKKNIVSLHDSTYTFSNVLSWFQTCERSLFGWFVVDMQHTPISDQLLPYTYTFDEKANTLQVQENDKRDEKDTTRLCVLSSTCSSGVFTNVVLHVLKQHRFRMSIYNLVKQLTLQVKEDHHKHTVFVMSNYRLHTKKTYFGFG